MRGSDTLILGIDVGGKACSVALIRGREVLAQSSEQMLRGHAARLLPMAAGMISRVGVATSSIGLIGVTIGPGGFTGLRIGLAAAGGMALAGGAKVVGVPSFDALDAQLPKPEQTRLLVLDSRRHAPFVEINRQGIREAPSAASPREIADRLPSGPIELAGDGATDLAAILGRDEIVVTYDGPIDPVIVAQLAWAMRCDAMADPPPPAYLRPPDAKPLASAS